MATMSWSQWITQKIVRFALKGILADQAAVDKFLRNEAAKTKKGPYSIPAKLKNAYSVSLLSNASCPTHVIAPKNEEPESIIIYFHGGAYAGVLDDIHITGLSNFLKEFGKVAFVIPEYPLTPNSTHTKIFETAEAVYREVVANWPTKKIALMGDSAGGGMSLIVAQRLAAAKKNGDSIKQPDSVVLLSPWLDVSMSNPECAAVAPSDPFLDVYGLKVLGELVAGGPDPVSTKDPKVSPLFGSLEGLPPVSVWTGSHDLLIPDSRALRDRFQNEGISTRFRYNEEAFMIHCWVLFGMPESKKAIKEIWQAIQEDFA